MTNEQQFPHFMLNEIYQQPDVVRTCLTTYLLEGEGHGARGTGQTTLAPCASRLAPSTNLNLPIELYSDLEQIHILGCGSSRHAGLVAQYWLEQIANIPTRICSGSEFQSAPLPLTANTLTIGVTQSGETADTLAAMDLERQRRLSEQAAALQPRLLGVTNQPASSLAKRVDYVLPTLAGEEIGVAATKTFVNQLVVFACLTLELSYWREAIADVDLQQFIIQLHQIPSKIQQVLEQDSKIKALADQLADAQHCIVLGRGINRAIALEGALKLKETTYLHAEGYAAGEFLHGPIALLDASIPVIAIAPSGSTYPAILPTIHKAKSHGGTVIGIVTADNAVDTADLFDHQIVLPGVDERLSPLLTVIPLQLLAYHIATQRGLDVDRPRNITKTCA